MTNGKLVMQPNEAIAKASEMKDIALRLEELLNEISNKMEYVNNIDKGMYFGDNKPAALMEELNKFKGTFSFVRDQIIKSSNDIIKIANRSLNQ